LPHGVGRFVILTKRAFYQSLETQQQGGRHVINPPVQDHQMLSAVFAKMDVPALAISLGVVCSIAMFLATAILLVQDVPDNYPIGPHLGALADYLPGYSVSWPGSVIGTLYGFLAGMVAGFFIAVYWNLAHYIAIGIMLIKSAELVD
jgi:hypothetical protein